MLFQLLIHKKASSDQNKVDILIRSEIIPFKNLTVSLWGPTVTVYRMNFSGKTISRKDLSCQKLRKFMREGWATERGMKGKTHRK